MKNSLFLFMILSVLGAGTVSAQSQITYGVRGGLTISDWQGEAVGSMNKIVNVTGGMANTTSRKAFYAGGYINVPFSEKLSLEPGVFFSQKGYTIKGNLEISALKFLGTNANVQMQMGYIDVPVIVKLNVANGLHIFAGPQVSYLAYSNLRLDAGILGFSLFQRDVDMTGSFNRWDAGLTGGVAYQFGNGLNIQAGYEQGLSRLDANRSLRSNNRVIKVGLGFTF